MPNTSRMLSEINDDVKCPNVRLATAVVERALRDALTDFGLDQSANKEFTRAEARRWLRCDDYEEGSFLWWADAMRGSPGFVEAVRRRLDTERAQAKWMSVHCHNGTTRALHGQNHR